MANPTLSVVVPAFNEEHHIGACLESLVEQIGDIDEILVIDNNSVDGTEGIVRRYAERIGCLRLIREPKQGINAARTAGFDAATSEIIGRVDADTIVRPGWAVAIKKFIQGDIEKVFGGVPGLSVPYESPFGRLKESFVRVLIAAGLVGNDIPIDNMLGANMAIRKTTWLAVREYLSSRQDIHEDVDLALTINDRGQKVAWLSDMWVDTSPRRRLTPPTEFTEYVRAGVETFALHGKATRQVRYVVAPVTWAMHALTWLPYRAYDPQSRRLSVSKLTDRVDVRTSPVSSRADRRAG